MIHRYTSLRQDTAQYTTLASRKHSPQSGLHLSTERWASAPAGQTLNVGHVRPPLGYPHAFQRGIPQSRPLVCRLFRVCALPSSYSSSAARRPRSSLHPSPAEIASGSKDIWRYQPQ